MSDATLREKAAAFIAEHEGCDEYCSAACDALPIVREVARLEAELAEATHAAQMATEDNRQISQDVRRLNADKRRLEAELAEAREALNIMAYTTEAELTNWKGDFQEACRQRDKAEAELAGLRDAWKRAESETWELIATRAEDRAEKAEAERDALLKTLGDIARLRRGSAGSEIARAALTASAQGAPVDDDCGPCVTCGSGPHIVPPTCCERCYHSDAPTPAPSACKYCGRAEDDHREWVPAPSASEEPCHGRFVYVNGICSGCGKPHECAPPGSPASAQGLQTPPPRPSLRRRRGWPQMTTAPRSDPPPGSPASGG